VTTLFLGVDGGQSSTTALVGDETGRVVGVGRAGPCNHVEESGGREKFRAAIGGCVHDALREAGAPSARFHAACSGFSGGPADKDALAREIVPAEKHLITHDAEIALVGATSGEPGVIAIAGTGSIVFGRNGEGRTARAGGWGYLFGDEAGGFDLVRQALRASLRHEEGWGPKTALREALLEATGARDANDLVHRFYTDEYPRARVASFAHLVDDAARSGDAVARDILSGAAQTLATLAAAVRRQLFQEGEAVRVSYSGGVFRSGFLLERYRMLVELEDGALVAPPVYSPAVGALIEAYGLAGVNPNQLETTSWNLSRTSSTHIA
jgi:N-acetylglucosamine kinase-like BadF-type ATPase